jgi:hypothetical protein
MPQRWKPGLQLKSQTFELPASVTLVTQVAVPSLGAGHVVHRPPHDSGAVSDTQASPQRWKPFSHAKSHCRLVHAGREFGGKEQGPQSSPQEFGEVSSAQAVPHWWNPARHERPQRPPAQVAVPLVAPRHASQRVPQVATSSFEAQVAPQRWKLAGQTPASGTTRSHRLLAQVSASSQARQNNPPVPHDFLSLPGKHCPSLVQQPSGQLETLQGGFSGHPESTTMSMTKTGIERTTSAFPSRAALSRRGRVNTVEAGGRHAFKSVRRAAAGRFEDQG